MFFWVALGFLSFQGADTPVLSGVDVLRKDEGAVSGRVGLITNHTGVARDGVSTLTVLRDELGVDIVALFSPEHGYWGDVAAGDDVGSTTFSAILIHSLYGDTRAPTPEMLDGIDTLVFDIQDIGVRFYTYISTMKLAMEAAAAAQIGFVVLDRPNPLGGVRVEGPVLDPDFASFVGIAPIPLVHGMTAGELARLFAASMTGLELEVIQMRGFRRSTLWKDTGLSWNPPSPNIRTARAALAYPAFGLIEGINVNEGRGIEDTFERIGAPWIDGEKLAAALSQAELPGVRFRSTSFTPRAIAAAPRPKYRDEICYGVAMTITDEARFEAVRTGLTTIATIKALHPEAFEWVRRGEGYWIDLLLGTDRPRRALEDGMAVDAIVGREASELARFIEHRRAYLLY
ncbi:MAG: DUF1343 domain-containing protein [Acidobacteria bacterium]|nr:MAG: DUF1343 domain-containing protein [Acidobacteriota bacterium]